MTIPSLALASTSPRRREILARLGLPFEAVAPLFEEVAVDGRSARDEAMRFAEAKARSLSDRFPRHIIIGGDTLIDCEGEKIGKPRDADDARRILRRLSGRTHTVWTAVAIVDTTGPTTATVTAEGAQVTMKPVGDIEIARYVATGEPLDKAGAYAIQGGAASWIEKCEGDMLAVIGLLLAPITAYLETRGRLRGTVSSSGECSGQRPHLDAVPNIDVCGQVVVPRFTASAVWRSEEVLGEYLRDYFCNQIRSHG